MSNRVLRLVFVALSLTLFGVGLFAQDLPDYGIRRIQTASELSFGTLPQNATVLNDRVLIHGIGWDTIDIFTTGSYFSTYDGIGTNTIEFDTVRIYSINDFERGSTMTASGSLLSIRNANYDPIDTVFYSSGSASILELVETSVTNWTVFQIDSLSLDASDAEQQTVFLTSGVTSLDAAGGDTIRFVFNSGFSSNRPAIVELRSYVPDPVLGYRKVNTIPITDNIESNDFQIGVWSYGDTLGRAQLRVEQGDVNLYVRYFDVHTGNSLGSSVLVKTQVSGIARVVASQNSRLGYVTESQIDWNAPRFRRTTSKVWAFDLRTGDLKWQNEYISRQDWFTNPDREFTRIDSSGRFALTAYPSAKVYDNSTGERDWQIELKAANAVTGDSLWTTYLQLDSFATRDYGMSPMDIAMKPNGEGYVVAAWVSETKLDPHRDLRYSYTALFFLDSLGCLAPGCRDASSTKIPTLGYEISLAPNPIQAGGELSVSFPESVSAVRYAITNAHGQRIRFSESERVTGGRLHVPIDILSSGMYYLTVWPADSGNAMLTRGFVVE